MIESRCPTCGGRVLLPDPPPRTKEENIAFRKEWDRRVEEGLRRAQQKQEPKERE